MISAALKTGAMLDKRLMQELVKLLDGSAIFYGKSAIVGVDGEMEHGGACVHPMLGRPMRAVIGGGEADDIVESQGRRRERRCAARAIRTTSDPLISTRSLYRWPTHPALVGIVIAYDRRQQNRHGIQPI